jgi:hypothetical protein
VNGSLAINGLLSQASGLKQLVAARIYPDVMPDGPTYPSVTYQRLGGSSERGSTSDPPLKSAVFQVSAWAKSRVDARMVAAQIRVALDRQRKVTVAGVQVDDCFYQDDIDLFDFETRTYFAHLTFKIFYRDPL